MDRHVISAEQFDRKRIEMLCEHASTIRVNVQRQKTHYMGDLTGKFIIPLFYEPSTRTRMSFQIAAHLCGMTIPAGTENAREFSSAVKGETLEDTIGVLGGYHPDVIVLRHHEEGAAMRAVQALKDHGLDTAIINAGDGKGEHPTQALLDVYTISEEFEHQIDGLHVVFGGDLKYGRTVHSLTRVLAKFDRVSMSFVAPEELQIGEDIRQLLDQREISYTMETNPQKVLGEADVVYWTRVQKERMDPKLYDEIEREGTYHIGVAEVQKMKTSARILHPLPRVKEIDTKIDQDPRAAYFRQAQNGLYVRMALLRELLSISA